MAITKTTTPYEFLVRWRDGAISGAHIKFIETLAEDGVVLSQKEGTAMPVSMAGEEGFPLSDVLSNLQIQALIELAAAQEALAAKDAEIAELKANSYVAAPVATP